MTARLSDPRRNRGNAAFHALRDEPTYSEEWRSSLTALYVELGIHYTPLRNGHGYPERRCIDCGCTIKIYPGRPSIRCRRCQLRWWRGQL